MITTNIIGVAGPMENFRYCLAMTETTVDVDFTALGARQYLLWILDFNLFPGAVKPFFEKSRG